MAEWASESPLPVIQAVVGFPSKKATLFIISTVKKERRSPENFLLRRYRQGFTASTGWELPRGSSGTVHRPEGHAGHAAPAQVSCGMGHWLLNVKWVSQSASLQLLLPETCGFPQVKKKKKKKSFIILQHSSGGQGGYRWTDRVDNFLKCQNFITIVSFTTSCHFTIITLCYFF